ncbi:hypothetical protein [Nitrospirillum amazonense]|uniref:hypothetical protein n=1 Tax=Nitrospirillum amazonense TaxID=28077 RepID=UPI00119E240C|nr:hypothetical protein [Nitrospirillum amazonense]
MIRFNLVNIIHKEKNNHASVESYKELRDLLDGAIRCDLRLEGASLQIEIEDIGIVECYTAILGAFSESLLWGEVAPFMTYDDAKFYCMRRGEAVQYFLANPEYAPSIGDCKINFVLDDINKILQKIREDLRGYADILRDFVWMSPGSILYSLARGS